MGLVLPSRVFIRKACRQESPEESLTVKEVLAFLQGFWARISCDASTPLRMAPSTHDTR